jgi:predicted metal-dependent HD superfamily phosphohydrolase
MDVKPADPPSEAWKSLYPEWEQLVGLFGVPAPKARTVFRQLADCYASPGRYYHTLDHIRAVLARIDSLSGLARNLPAIQLAAWFHDAIYDPRARDNEEKSAVLAQEVLQTLQIPREQIEQAMDMILKTKNHQAASDDVDSQILLDADLAILGAPAPAYEQYARAIRQEYAWVPEEHYRAGRRQVLQSFLQRPQIYYTGPMVEALERRARQNLEKEVASLT